MGASEDKSSRQKWMDEMVENFKSGRGVAVCMWCLFCLSQQGGSALAVDTFLATTSGTAEAAGRLQVLTAAIQ